MKKSFLAVMFLVLAGSLFAQEQPESPKWRFSTAVTIPVPVVIASESRSFPLKLGENPLFSMASLSLSFSEIVSPITVGTSCNLSFAPIPLINFGIGGSVNSGWKMGDFSFLTLYDEDADTFVKADPFSAITYSVNARAGMSFDFGLLKPGIWTHVITNLSYSVSYDGCSAASRYEIWGSGIEGENVNGLKYSATASLSYLMPIPLTMIGLNVSFSGHFDGDDYGKYNKNYDGDFVSINIASSAMFRLGNKDGIMVMAFVPSRRKFVESSGSNILKTTNGREWMFGGIFGVWTHSF